MDIFGKDGDAHKKLLALYTNKPLMFSALRNSTLTAKGRLNNIQFNESNYCDKKEITNEGVVIKQAFNCSKQIVTDDSNFTHSRFAG